MKKKHWFLVLFICVSIISVVSLGLNIYFLATMPPSAYGIFNSCKASILEIRAETEDVGISYGTAELISTDGTTKTFFKPTGGQSYFDSQPGIWR